MGFSDEWGSLGNGYAEDIRGEGHYPQGLRTARSTHLSRMQHGATLLGISLEAYVAHVEAGEKWCSRHRAWEPLGNFGKTLGSNCRRGAAEKQQERRRMARQGGV